MTATHATSRIPFSALRSLPWPNPNVMSAAQQGGLRQSMLMVGYAQQILVRPCPDGMYEIVDGEHRYSTLAAMLAETSTDRVVQERLDKLRAAHADQALDCVVRAMTDEQARALQLGFNRLRGEVDLSRAAQSLVHVVKKVDIDDLLVTGFTHEEIDALVKSVTSSDIPADVGHLPDLGSADEDDAEPLPFVLELRFSSHDELKKVRRALRKAAGGGRKADMARGLLRLITGE